MECRREKKKHTRYILLILSLSVLLSACLSAPTVAVAPPKTSIRVVMDDNYPPYVFLDEQGSARGILVDQWALWEKYTGVKVELTAIPWEEALSGMEAGKFDVIDTIFYTDKRAKVYDFTDAYAVIDVPIFFQNNISGIVDAGDLKGFRVAVKSGDADAEYLADAGITGLVYYNNYEEIIQAAANKQETIFVVDQPPGQYFLYKYRLQDQFNYSAPLFSGEFRRAVRKGDTEILNLVVSGFDKISKAEYETIYDRWFGFQENNGWLVYLPFLRIGILIILLIILILIVFNRSLQKRVSQSEGKFKAIANQATEGIALSDLEGKYIFVNPAFCRMTGYSEAELLKMTVFDVKAKTQSNGSFFESKTKMEGLPIQVNLQRKDGTEFFTEIIGRVIKINNVDFVLGTVRDISERKRAEEEMRDSQERFEATIEASGVGTWDWNIQTGETVFNRRWAEMVGYSLDELSPVSIQTWIDLAHADDLKLSTVLLEKHFNGETGSYEFEGRMRHKNGQWIWVLDRGRLLTRTADGKPLRMLGTHTDITERKQAEGQLRQQAILTQFISDAVITIDREIVITSWNEAAARIYGWSAVDAIGRSMDELLKTRFSDVSQEDARIVLEQTGIWQGQIQQQTKSNRIVDMDVAVTFLKDETGNIIGGITINRDVTERRQAEDQLRQLSRAVEYSPVSIMITDINGRIEYVNPKFTRLNGFTLDEIRGNTPRVLKSGTTSPEDYSNLWKTILSGGEWRGEFLNRKKNGELYWEYASISTISDSKGNITHFVSVNEDITARKEAEEKIQLLNTELEHLALTDHLTGLFNRRYFMQQGTLEFKRANRHSHPLSLLMLDVDEFKKVNDNYGHEVGDLALQQVAVALKNGLRETDILGRMGGEEFAILLPATPLHEAALLADRIRQSIVNTSFQTPGDALIVSISICVGVAAFTDEMSDIDDLLRNADAALYFAKNNGRNQVIVYKDGLEAFRQPSNLEDE